MKVVKKFFFQIVLKAHTWKIVSFPSHSPPFYLPVFLHRGNHHCGLPCVLLELVFYMCIHLSTLRNESLLFNLKDCPMSVHAPQSLFGHVVFHIDHSLWFEGSFLKLSPQNHVWLSGSQPSISRAQEVGSWPVIRHQPHPPIGKLKTPRWTRDLHLFPYTPKNSPEPKLHFII